MSTRRSSSAPNRHGAAIVYIVVALIVLMGFVSLAVDLGHVQLVKTQLQMAADSAAHAAANALSGGTTAAQNAAVAAANANTADGTAVSLTVSTDVIVGTWSTSTNTFTSGGSSPNAVKVIARRTAAQGHPVSLTFGKLIGESTCNVNASSIAAITFGSANIMVMVQDVTGSFSNEIASAKSGDLVLLSNLNSSYNSALGLVVFTGWGYTIAPLQTVSGNYTALTNYVNSLGVDTTGMPPTGTGSDIAAGIEQAITVFHNFTTTSTNKGIVIVTDGDPNGSSSGSHPTLSDAQLLTLAQTDANTAWADGYSVSVILWNSTNNAQAATDMATLIRGKGKLYNVTSASQLAGIIANVNQSIALVQ